MALSSLSLNLRRLDNFAPLDGFDRLKRAQCLRIAGEDLGAAASGVSADLVPPPARQPRDPLTVAAQALHDLITTCIAE